MAGDDDKSSIKNSWKKLHKEEECRPPAHNQINLPLLHLF